MGIFDDKNIKEYNPEKYWDYNLNSSDDGVECLTDLFERCQNFLDDVIPKNRDKKNINSITCLSNKVYASYSKKYRFK